MKQIWIIKPLKEDKFEGFRVRNDLKKFQFFPEIEISQLKNQRIYLIIEPQVFLTDILEVPGKIPEFINFQVENRVRESGIFLTSPKAVYKVIETTEISSKIFVFGIEEKIINTYLEKLRKVQARVELVTHKLLAIFCGIKKRGALKPENFPLLLIIVDLRGIWYLVISEKIPLYAKFSSVDEFIGISVQTILEDILILKDYFSRFFREEFKGIALLGKERDAIKKEEIYSATKLPVVDLKSLEFEEFYNYPEIFGAIELESEFNFLPESEKIFLNQIKWIEKLTPFLLGFTGLNLLIGGVFYKFNLDLKNKIEKELLLTKELINTIFYKLPENSIEKLKTYINFEKEKITGFQLNEFLIWLSQIWDKDFSLKNLKVENTGNNISKISIDLEITGSFPSTQAKTDELIKNLSKHFKIESSNFNFVEKENKAILNLKLSLIK